jgi:DNA-binding response OmpR family regulator
MREHLVFFEKEEDFFASDNSAVLLTEGDEMTEEITTEMFHYIGYTVKVVTRGEEAVALYKLRREEGSPFKAVILDIGRTEGLDEEVTLRRLLEYDPDVKAVASSGFTADKNMIGPRRNGFRARLPKPYGIRQLGSVLRSVIGSGLPKKGLTNIRKEMRHGVIANFQFVVGDKSQHVCEGIAINISKHGFAFLTEAFFAGGQAITVTKHNFENINGSKARIMWVKKGLRQYRAGAKFVISSCQDSGSSCQS